MNDYVYKDNEVTMPAFSEKFTSRIGDGSGYHEQFFHDTVNLLAHARSAGSMIDIGCGMGRTTLEGARIVSELVALEPDAARWNYTRELVAEFPHVAVLNQTTQQYIAANPGKQFDLSVLGMVVQHLPTHLVTRVMDDLATLTRPGGIAVVATTHAMEKARCFTYQKVEDGRLNAQISEEEFNRYAENTAEQDKGLPVHRFSRSEFEAIVPQQFDITYWQQYSYYRPEHLEYFAWRHSVTPEELADVGNSQFLVLRRK